MGIWSDEGGIVLSIDAGSGADGDTINTIFQHIEGYHVSIVAEHFAGEVRILNACAYNNPDPKQEGCAALLVQHSDKTSEWEPYGEPFHIPWSEVQHLHVY